MKRRSWTRKPCDAVTCNVKMTAVLKLSLARYTCVLRLDALALELHSWVDMHTDAMQPRAPNLPAPSRFERRQQACERLVSNAR